MICRNADDPDQFLGALIRTDRDHQPAANLQLLLKGHRDLRPAGRHDNGIVGRMFQPAAGAVAMQDTNIVVAETGQCRGSLVRELAETFDRVDGACDFRQHRGGVAGTGADLEDVLAALEQQCFRHEGYDIGLGNRLPAADRERRVLVSEFAEVFRQE